MTPGNLVWRLIRFFKTDRGSVLDDRDLFTPGHEGGAAVRAGEDGGGVSCVLPGEP